MRGICYLCGRENNLTVEHVIPQCLGGVLSQPLYCNKCNGATGHNIDAELAKQFGRYATILCISRDRGQNQPFEMYTEGSDLLLRCDGRNLSRVEPVVRIETTSEGKLSEAEVIARSKAELQNIFKGISARYNIDPQVDVVEPIENPAPTAYHEIVIDNPKIRRAVAKIAYSFACLRLPPALVTSSAFAAIREFILGSSGASLACANYVAGDFMIDNQRPLHKLHLKLERENGLLIGYVALFGTFRYSVLVAEGVRSDVAWPGIDYTFNPVTQREVRGNEDFVAPSIGKENAIAPKNSRQQVLQALNRGEKVIAAHSPIINDVWVEENGA